MHNPLARMSTRARTALAAGLAALLLAGIGAWWLRQHLYDAQFDTSRSQATYQARAIARDNTADQGATYILHADTVGLPFMVIDPNGHEVLRGDPLVGLAIEPGQLASAPSDSASNWTTEESVHIDSPGQDNRMSGRTFSAVGVASFVDVQTYDSTYFTAGPGIYTVYVLVTPFEAEDAVSAITLPLGVGVPFAALLVAGIAWIATSRALRPVDAIRAELAEITENDLGRRVPVPVARDEIWRMATTTNRTLDRLEHAAEQQRRFVADASHELRSPIAALRTNLEVSLKHEERVDWPRATREALLTVQRLQDLTEDLLFLTKPTSHDLREASVDLTSVATELISEARHMQPDGPDVSLEATGPLVVRGHAWQLHRLLRNLLDNAIRHASSAVVVRTHASQRWAVVEVTDDGAGIPTADRDRIFERFTRLDDARSRDAGGSGLGLAIARAIALRHGGTLAVADAGGPGATFVVRMPLPPELGA